MRILKSAEQLETTEIREIRKQLEKEYVQNGFRTSETLLALSGRLDQLLNQLHSRNSECPCRS